MVHLYFAGRHYILVRSEDRDRHGDVRLLFRPLAAPGFGVPHQDLHVVCDLEKLSFHVGTQPVCQRFLMERDLVVLLRGLQLIRYEDVELALLFEALRAFRLELFLVGEVVLDEEDVLRLLLENLYSPQEADRVLFNGD